MAMDPKSPMYKPDVEQLDRQDDTAATRLFCAAVLEYLSENHPEYVDELGAHRHLSEPRDRTCRTNQNGSAGLLLSGWQWEDKLLHHIYLSTSKPSLDTLKKD